MYVIYFHIYFWLFLHFIVVAILSLFRYSQLNPLCFSLAYSGVLVRRNSQRQQSSNDERHSQRSPSHSLLSDVSVHTNEGGENGKKAN